MPDAHDEIAEVVDGLVEDVYRAERALTLLKTIGTHSPAINASSGGHFGNLFGGVQDICFTEVLMAVARLFDRPHPKHPTRSAIRLLAMLDGHAGALLGITERPSLARHLVSIGAPAVAAIVRGDAADTVVTAAIARHFRARIDDPETSLALNSVKRLRNKRLAHNQAVALPPGPLTWGQVERLVRLVQELIGTVGWGYQTTVYMQDGRYLGSTDAQMPGMSLRRLFGRLGLDESIAGPAAA